MSASPPQVDGPTVRARALTAAPGWRLVEDAHGRWLVWSRGGGDDPQDPAADLAELEQLSWLAANTKVPVPSMSGEACASGAWPDGRSRAGASRSVWFVAPPGEPGDAPVNLGEAQATLEAAAVLFRQLHDSTGRAPLAELDAASLVERAARRAQQGTVDVANIAPARVHLDPLDLVEQLRELLPLLERRQARGPVQLVPTHGRARLGSIWVHHGRATALIGVAGLALADPYRDLGAMARDLASIYGPEALACFFDAYGLPDPDPVRLEFHALLDELS